MLTSLGLIIPILDAEFHPALNTFEASIEGRPLRNQKSPALLGEHADNDLESFAVILVCFDMTDVW